MGYHHLMTRIIGIDPGSRITGFGIIDWVGNKCTYIDSGCIRLTKESLPERLQQIYQSIIQLIETYTPKEMAIENVFVARNPASALKLGHARGVAIVAGVNNGLPIAEYSAKQVKQSVVGKGAADKNQVQHMVTVLLKLKKKPQADAADALAIAICHAHTQQSLIRMTRTSGSFKHGRLQHK